MLMRCKSTYKEGLKMIY